MKIKKVILSVLVAFFLVSLILCGRNCMLYEKAAKNIATAEAYHEQLQQRNAERVSNDWNYAMNLGAGYVAQRKEAQATIERAQEAVWEKEDIAEALAAKALLSTGITIILFFAICIFSILALRKKQKI